MSKITELTGSVAPENDSALHGSKATDGARIESSSLKVNVIRLTQKGVTMYIGKMTSQELLGLWEIDKFKDDDLSGYQRQMYDGRTEDILEYLRDCPIAVMPGVLVSVNNGRFRSLSAGDSGILEIPDKRGSVWVIDGQHRLGGFDLALKQSPITELSGMDQLTPETIQALKEYELPVVFIDSSQAAREIKLKTSPEDRDVAGPSLPLSEKDIERVVFFIVNKTAKGISPSLKDALAYKIKAAGIGGIPIIEEKPWRYAATKISLALFRNGKIGSPFSGLMKITGVDSRIARGTGRPLTLSTFVTSLEHLVQENHFRTQDHETQLAFVTQYWQVIRSVVPEAFTTPKEYMVLKSMGVYALNWLAMDIFEWSRDTDSGISSESFRKYLEPLKTFNWTKEKSPLAMFGGLKGVRASYKLLLKHLDGSGITEAGKRLAEIEREEGITPSPP